MLTRAVILGGASCVWDDLAALEEILGRPWNGLVVAINDALPGCVGRVPRVDHFVTQHHEKITAWKEVRRQAGGNMDFVTWGCIWLTTSSCPGAELTDAVVVPWGSGSSGFHAVTVCELIGVPRVLCGVPLTNTEHFSGALMADTGAWLYGERHREPWVHRAERYREGTRSMSGWTAEFLGMPDREWLGLDTP